MTSETGRLARSIASRKLFRTVSADIRCKLGVLDEVKDIVVVLSYR